MNFAKYALLNQKKQLQKIVNFVVSKYVIRAKEKKLTIQEFVIYVF